MTPNGCTQQTGGCPTCVRGTCDQNLGRCVCPEHYTGKTCDECASGWSGQNCAKAVDYEKPGTTPTTISAGLIAIRVNFYFCAFLQIICIVVACLVIVLTAAFLLYRRYFAKPATFVAVAFDDLSTMDDEDVDTESATTRKKPSKSSPEPEKKLVPLDDQDD